MAAPVGNQFWEKRTKHGVDAVFTEPAKLWEAAVEYFNYTQSRVWVKKDWVGKDAVEVERESCPPFTLIGLCLFFGVTEAWWRQFKGTNTYKDNKDFPTLVAHIESIIYNQKFEGAAVGAFNANIIARDLGLRDTQQVGNIPGESFNVTLDLK